MTYEIKKNVPIPGYRGRFPFAGMEVGDSFDIDNADTARKARVAASYFNKRHNRKYSIRCTDPVRQTYGCWRIA